MPYQLMQPRFPLGRIFATPATSAVITAAIGGDELCAEDKQANENSLKDGTRLLSRYSTPGGSIYIITEHDRSMTTILLPSEY